MTTNPFRSENGGNRITYGLFFETSHHNKDLAIYTLKDKDLGEFKSLYRLYMEMEDLTEYHFANTYLDGWEHWEMLTSGVLKNHVGRWRKELELKIKSKALFAIQAEAADNDSKNSFQANKYLLEKGWMKDEAPSKTRGRPSKAEIQAKAQELAEESHSVLDDAKRLGIN